MTEEKMEAVPVIITGPDGQEREYVEEKVIPFAGEKFAVLVALPDYADQVEDGLDIILTKMVTNENGEVEYIPPTDKEFEAVAEIYEKM